MASCYWLKKKPSESKVCWDYVSEIIMAVVGSLKFSNFPQFRKHLENASHMVKQGENAETLLKHAAFKRKTCFVKPMESEDGSIHYTSIEEEELLPLLKKAVMSGQKFPQGDGRTKAIYRFQRCIGVFPILRNRIDETNGFEIKQIYSIKVVYKPTDREDIIDGITAYPLFDPSQESY